MLEGVRYIHNQGLMHRDLKPSNIFFSLAGRKIKIGDFGLVTTSQGRMWNKWSEVTSACVSIVALDEPTLQYYVGTSRYNSPEQLKGERYGQEVDIYALGIIFFEMNCPDVNTEVYASLVQE